MEKLALIKNDKMGDYEKEQGFASYRTIIDYYIGDIVLCNEITNIDESAYDNMIQEDKTNETSEIFQYYLCNVSEWEKEQLQKAGVILSYSNMLDVDVLCVDHFGTSWDYVLTDVPLFETYEELKQYEDESEGE